jgi:hypothetical protein
VSRYWGQIVITCKGADAESGAVLMRLFGGARDHTLGVVHAEHGLSGEGAFALDLALVVAERDVLLEESLVFGQLGRNCGCMPSKALSQKGTSWQMGSPLRKKTSTPRRMMRQFIVKVYGAQSVSRCRRERCSVSLM